MFSLYSSHRGSGEMLLKYQLDSSCVIMSLILVTNEFCKAFILQRESYLPTFSVISWQISNRSEAHLELNSLRRKNDCALIIKGDSLEVCLKWPSSEYFWFTQIFHLYGSSTDYCSNLFCQVCLRHYEQEFIELACNCPVVVCCRCSPQQKADIVTLLKKHTGKRTCAIGEIMNHCVLGAICMLPSTIWWCAAEQIHVSLKSFLSTICQLHDAIL